MKNKHNKLIIELNNYNINYNDNENLVPNHFSFFLMVSIKKEIILMD